MEGSFSHIATLALAIISFAGAHVLEGNGFIAAFVAGLTFGGVSKQDKSHLFDFAEEEGQLLTLLTFLVFGAALLPEALALADARVWLYSVLSLTVVRMLPVALALMGTPLTPSRRAFVGWFGPRGLASILFALLVVESSELNNRELIVGTVFVTVFLSVILHGLSAQPLSRRLESSGADDS